MEMGWRIFTSVTGAACRTDSTFSSLMEQWQISRPRQE